MSMFVLFHNVWLFEINSSYMGSRGENDGKKGAQSV